MDFIGLLENYSFRLWLAQSITVFFLVSGVFLLLAGLGLMLKSAATLDFFGRMNRWVSLRRVSKPLEVQRDISPAVQKYRYALGAVFFAGGGFALIGLLTQFERGAFITLLNLNYFHPTYAAWFADALRWVLITGNVLAVVAGVMLVFSPDKLMALEARGSVWYSERKAARGADTMHFTLDAWVGAHPRPAGAIIALFALGLIGAFALLLPGIW